MAAIVVVGGGLAGLACGWRLARQGHAVRVLERAAAVGGRARSERVGPWLLDSGCPVVVPGQRRVLALAREAGLLGSLRPLTFGRDLRWRRGTLAAFSPRDALELVRLPRAALRAALDFQRPARLDDAGVTATAADVSLRTAAADALGWWPCAPPACEGAVCATLRASLPLAAPHAFAGGMGALADALARPLDVVTDCEVLRIETDSEGAHLTHRVAGGDRQERADAVVVAVPAPQVARLCPKLTPEERGFFERSRSEPGIVVHLLFERAPRMGARSVWLGSESGFEVTALLAEHARADAAPHGAGVLRAVLAPAAASRMFRASDASIADLVLENLAYSPLGPQRPDAFAVWRHAHLAPRFDAEHGRRLARFVGRLERSPRMAFAGDFLAGPSSDAAVASGLRAAREIARGA